MENRRDDEADAAVFRAVRVANDSGAYPKIDELTPLLLRRGLTANEIGAAADRLYRGRRVSVNSDGGMNACD